MLIFFLKILDLIFSLVRTKELGHLHDATLLDVALSRSTRSAVILGNYQLFSKHHQEYFAPLSVHSRKLQIFDKSFKNVEEICEYVFKHSQ